MSWPVHWGRRGSFAYRRPANQIFRFTVPQRVLYLKLNQSRKHNFVNNLSFYFFLLFCTLVACNLPGQVTKIKDAGPDAKRINFVILGDGYTASQQGGYAEDAQDITDDFFNEPPFLQYTNFFNVHTLELISEESGADHPGTATDVTEPVFAIADLNTALDARFDAGNIHRLLVVNNSKVFQALAANYPDFDQALIIVNTPNYGGSGGATAVGSVHPSASDLALHEAGHSFMNLGDEYNSGSNIERPNITAQFNAGNTKWNDWIGTNGVGEFVRNGATFKPVDGECMMEFLNKGFCSVCQEQTIETIYNTVSPLETTTPATANVAFDGTPLDFSITSIKPVPNTLTYEWELDGTLLASGVENLTLDPSQITNVFHRVLVRVKDETNLSRKNANYVFTYEWTITATTVPLEWISFTAQAEGKINRLDWQVAEPDGSSHFLLERSRDGVSWNSLERVLFTGATSYRYYDEAPLAGNSYYRIRAVNFDGTLTDSPVREVRSILRRYFKVWPSVTSGPVNCEVYTDDQAETLVTVVNSEGRVVNTRKIAAAGGWAQESLDLSAFPSGTYFVRIIAGGEVHTQRVMKQ